MQVETEKLGKFLRSMREIRGLSLRGLARLSRTKGNKGERPLTYSHISKIENGEVSPNMRTLQKFSEALDIPLVVIIEGSKMDPNTVTIVSTSEFSQNLIKALYRRDLAQLLVLCQNLTEGQIAEVLSTVHSISNTKSPQNEIESQE